MKASASWTHIFSMADRSGYSSNNVVHNNILWSKELPIEGTVDITSSPLIYNDTIYITHYDTLFAIDRHTGEIDWTYSEGKFLHWAPVVGSDTIIISQRHSNTIAISSDGEKRWEYPAESDAQIISNGSVYLSSHSNLIKLNIYNGNEIWVYNTGQYLFPPTLGNNSVYVGSHENCNIYSINQTTGDLNWIFPTSDKHISQMPVFHDGAIYFSSWMPTSSTSAIGKITAIDENGFLLWSIPIEGIPTKPSISNEYLFFTAQSADQSPSNENKVYALNSTNGNIIWSKNFHSERPVAVTSDYLYLTANKYELIALNQSDGSIFWRFGNRYMSPVPSMGSYPAISDGVIVMGGTGNTIFSIGSLSTHNNNNNEGRNYFNNYLVVVLITIGVISVIKFRLKRT